MPENAAIEAAPGPEALPLGRIKAALIDMDGTLYDSMPRHVAAWSRLASDLAIPHDPDEFYLYEGMTGAATLSVLFQRAYGRDPSPDEVAELYARKTRYFNELPAVGPMPGARDMLRSLSLRGITRVLVTGSGQRSLIDRLQADFPGAFSPDLMVTSASVTHGKPHPEPYLMAMKLAGVTPREALVIENAPLGVRSGHDSGAFTVALTTGPIPRQSFIDAGADLILPSMTSLASLLHNS